MTYFNEFGQGRVGWKSGTVAPSISYLLDTYSGAAAAYSLRKLRTAYTGNAITVRRSSDNTSTNIGFDSNGNLDTTALTTFVGSNNQALYSEEFDNANWSKYITTITSNQTTAPDGTITADLLAEASANNYHTLYNATILSFAVGTSWNVSVYVKKGPGTSAPNTIILGFPSPTTNTFPHPCVLFNISSGTVLDSSNVSNDANFGSSIVDAGNGWWRCSVWGTVTSAGNRYQHGVIRFNNNLNTINGAAYAGNAQSNIYIWGWQFQKALNDTSVLTTQPYTKTTATANAGNGFVSTWFDQSGNGRDLTQATAANQPRIVNSGVIEILNGKAGLYNSSSSVTSPNRMSANFGTTLSQPNTMFILGSSNFVTGGGTIIDGIVNGSRNSLAALDATKLYIFAGSLVQLNYAANSNTQRLLYGKFSTTSSAIAVNNGTAATGNVGVQPLTGIIINAAYTNGAGSTLNYQQEIIIWNADRSSDRTGISNDINTYYSTY